MGNWRTVHIEGTCPPEEVDRLRKKLTSTRSNDYANFGPLSFTGGLCGLPNWAATTINAVGNLAERDYSVEQVAKHLRELLVDAPRLKVKIHCGSDHESTLCIATIEVVDGDVKVGPAQINEIGDIPEGQIESNMRRALF